MTGDEKYAYHAKHWVAPKNAVFNTPEIEALYQKRAQRILDAVALREPDEVPVYFLAEGYVMAHGKLPSKAAFYDIEQFICALLSLHESYKLDYRILSFIQSGPALDILGMRQIRWPGSMVPGSALACDDPFQYVEDEYMRADEYDELISNPEGYFLRRYCPRIFGSLQGLCSLPNVFSLVETTGFASTLAGLSKGTTARQALDRLLNAADQAGEVMEKLAAADMKIRGHYGIPDLFGGITKTPYDIIGDTMRCTLGIVKDIYSRPEKVEAAVNALVPMAVQAGISTTRANPNPFVVIPLHKGSDDFLSPEQFRQFYWPTLKATMQGLIDEGFIPVPFAEGAYDKRLDIIAADPLPKGRSVWIFDRTDMAAAKEKIGPWACIAGNVPASLFKQASPDMLVSYCRDLIETCAPGGGFCLSPGTIINQANHENVSAFLECGRQFGTYCSGT
jgi:hypothetical protein